MSSPYFLDTNILIYATSLADDHAAKRPIAPKLGGPHRLGPVHAGTDGVLRQRPPARHGLLPTAPQAFVESLAARRPVQAVDRELVLAALSLRNRYNLSHWDAAILAPQRASAPTPSSAKTSPTGSNTTASPSSTRLWLSPNT
jgi:predicted nucleic acid-binding protein